MADQPTGMVRVILPPPETFEQAAVICRQLAEGVALPHHEAARAFAIFLLAKDFSETYLAHLAALMREHGIDADAVTVGPLPADGR